MKAILCTGSPFSGHEQVFELLVHAGVARAKAADQGGLSPESLQAQLLESLDVDLDHSPLDQVSVGKLWVQLAAGLFMANIDQPVWGWTDHQTTVLMDFWRDFDSQTRLVLVYSTAQDHLARVLDLSKPPAPQAVELALNQWSNWNTALLRYYCRHPSRCILVNSQQAIERPNDLLAVMATQWQLAGLRKDVCGHVQTHGHLQFHLISELIDTQHTALSLCQELDGAALIPSAFSVERQGNTSLHSAWSDWISIRAQLANQPQVAQVAAQLAVREQETQLLQLQVNELEKELEHYFLLSQELEQKNKVGTIDRDFSQVPQPAEFYVDMRKDVTGSNWYFAEIDGRWAGPELVSSITIPPLQAGHYTVSLDVVDAMHRDIVLTMLLEALGQSVGFEVYSRSNGTDYPVICKAQLFIPTVAQPVPWTISLRFTHVESPGTGDDRRQLAIRLQALRLSKNI